MSGFGNNTFGGNLGGFGTSGFGTGPTGGATSGFGAAPAPGGFGAPSGFGSDAQPGAGGFGASSAPTGFGASAVGFGTKTPAPGGFGTSPASGAHGFGPSPPLGGFGVAMPALGGFGATSVSGTFGASVPIAGGLGASSTPGGFGVSTPISGGFGAPAAPGGFGTVPPVAGGFSSISSGGFSAAPAPFGAAQVHSGFGAPLVSSGFGTPSAATGFSSAPSPTSFVGSGSSSSFAGFGVSVNPSFGHVPQSSSSGFSTSSSSTFGASAPNSSGIGSTNVSSGFTHGSGFAATPSTSTSFGAPVHTPFSQPAFPISQPSSQSSSAFGTTSNAFGSSSGFGNLSGFGGGNTYHSQPVAPGNPFGAGTGTPASAMTFGSSASVLQTTEVNMQDGSNDFDDGGFHGGIINQSGFGQRFATPSSLNPTAQSFAPQHFSSAPTFGMSSFGKPSSNDDDMGDEMPIHSPIPEASMTLPAPDVTFEEETDAVAKNKDDELARLKAKLAAKKKKLEEAKLRKSASDNSPPQSPKRHATSPNPTVVQERNNSTKTTEHASLAERNAFRFAPKVNASRSHLPDDLEPIAIPSQNEFDVMDLQNAKSLVGTCQFMCPDDELKRRENEGDIQLLETIHPDIHPAGWNLRNTAVKRFRRSAADYKLDIPELVRPPDVLERVCGYLEEWVMERDRQGPDPRFSTGVAPTPLEVYQFIWDRTRMVRKDFILQNYVGTGGKCDARAVRCHERIARWHAMCEHQLSHIPDFVRMQSQQNIAEMGQAMKTLNLFYDDSLGRSTVNVADDAGRETREQSSSHGCGSNIVMGVPPVDFDGSPLINDERDVARRIVGSKSPAQGTAEPEMRAIYILLTLENDGGMEVLKYAAKLSSERPEVFNSKPVQLALEIFKAKHELNYARFFSILRAQTTPYLFACLMFKHVEEMRRTAFRVMYMTYGYKKKDAPAIQDQYPLVTLVRLLCFEDIDEARSACEHYNITTKEVDLPSNSSPTGKKRLELIFWKASRFTIPKDEVKGIVIPLRPHKMLRTIESKLNGVTRLAVCRGEVSGEGSVLIQVPSNRASMARAHPLSAEEQSLELEKQNAAAVQREEERRKEAEWRKKTEEELRQKMELKRKLEEKKQIAEKARVAADEERTRVAKEKELEIENARRRAEAEERRRREEMEKKEAAEKARQRAEADAQEQRRLKVEAELKRKALEEEGRRKAEELAREHERQNALRKELEEQERQKQLIENENARKRQEDERARLRLLQEHLEKQCEEERRKANEEARRRAEREAEVNHAKKLLLWKRIRCNLDPLVQRLKTEQSLRCIDPTFSTVSNSPTLVQQSETDYRVHDFIENYDDPHELPLGDFLEELIQLNTDGSQLTDIVYKAVTALEDMIPTAPVICSSSVHTLTLACIVPAFECVQAETAHELLHKWLDSRFRYGIEQIYTSGFSEIRFVALNGNKISQWDQIDFALLVIPPYMNDVDFTNTALTSFLPNDVGKIPIVALNLEDGAADDVYKSFLESALTSCGVGRIVATQGDETQDFEAALGASFLEIMRLFVEDNERKRQEDVARHKELAEQHRLEGQRLVTEATRKNAEAEEKARNLLQKQLDLEDGRNKADDQERRWRLEVEHNKATKAASQKERTVNRSPTPTLDDEFHSGRKRSFEISNETPVKRGRDETVRERESKAFTARLEAILKGDFIVDTRVGDSTLRELLANVPPIREIPGSVHRK